MLISIDEIIAGNTLSKDVYSKLGGIIFKKGTNLEEGDKEILEAFGVKKIEVEEVEIKSDKKTNNNGNKNKQETKALTNTGKEYNKLFNDALKVIDNVFNLAQGNFSLPIMELRKALQPLLEDKYLDTKYLMNLKYEKNEYISYDTHHSLSVGILAYAIATWDNIENNEKMQIALAGVLHDIGMTKISPNILESKNKLTYIELDEIKKHTLYGYQILKQAKGINEGVRLAALQHHEKEDGTGYPLKIKSEKIHLYAKIVAVADIYHALISSRNYREELFPFQAIEQLIADGFGKIDPIIVRIFTKNMFNINIGTEIELNNGKIGSIVFIEQHNPNKPWVKVDDDIINLEREKSLFIKKIL